MEPVEYPLLICRTEEIEEDDTASIEQIDKPYYERAEPLPWGTLRLDNSAAIYKKIGNRAYLMSFVIFSTTLYAYLSIILGEFKFYSKLDEAKSSYLGNYPLGYNATNVTAADLDAALMAAEIMEGYEALIAFEPYAKIILLLLIPFALQVSALVAETCVVPMLVEGTLVPHITNFTKEIDQYLTVLAMNHGTLKYHHPPEGSCRMPERLVIKTKERQEELHDMSTEEYTGFFKFMSDTSISEEMKAAKLEKELIDLQQAELDDKVSMARDMALSWRMGKFFREVENDSKVINSSVAVMILNVLCHYLPINAFISRPTECVPRWIVLIFITQIFGLYFVLKGGIECNNEINNGIHALLHDWQLRFMMISWSGGFLGKQQKAGRRVERGQDEETPVDQERAKRDATLAKIEEAERKRDELRGMCHDDDEDLCAFMAMDPNETKMEKLEKETNMVTDVLGELNEAQRVESVVRILAHYEAEKVTPFKVLGVALTEEIITLLLGFFGGAIVGLVTHLVQDRRHMKELIMCHALIE